ncbi:hypothetical protein SKTS_29270 [Sulfurimicrobium lacus]|uniref:Uncharacterized protein n=2 Tax=Sulfurimicrobium lacus TaxID=2715678 RepID=A0A6F8VFV9_9PROT|nr:hypothetical protein SKTS_29270 [Sulfurimicrobium lacus]
MAPPPAAQTTTATIQSVSPSTLMPGQNYTLQLLGQGLRPGIKVDFGSGVTLTSPLIFAAEGGRGAQVNVRVEPGAAPGVRQVILTVPSSLAVLPPQPQPARITIMPGPGLAGMAGAAAPLPGVKMPPAPPAPPPQTPMSNPVPVIALQVVPNQWQTGKTYQLTLNGNDFVNGMELRFGDGVKIKTPPKIITSSFAQMEVEVASSAQPGVRLVGARMTPNQAWSMTSASVQVLAGFKPMDVKPKLRPFDTSFKPGRIELKSPGWSSTAKTDPATGTKMTCSRDGVALSGECNMADSAPLLQDDLVFRWQEKNPGTAEFFEFRILNKNGNVLMRKRLEGGTAVWPGSSQPTKLPPPTYYQPDPAFLDTLLNPATGPLSAAPSGTAKGGAKVKSPSSAKYSPAGSAGGAAQQESAPPVNYPNATDLLWEVAGYRVYLSNGVEQKAAMESDAPVRLVAANMSAQGVSDTGRQGMTGVLVQPGEPVEVEISDRWPLRKPNRPNGFGACPLVPQAQPVLRAQNMDKGEGDTSVAAVAHPFDNWILSGKVVLANSPYESHPGVELEPSKSSGSSQSGMGTATLPTVAKYRFDNLFVDWGDGTVVPLVGKPEDPLYNDQDKKGINGDVAMTLPDQQEYGEYSHTVAIGNKEHAARRETFFTHQYSRTGYFNIRVYQLAERDVQQANPADLADAYDHPSGSAGLGAYGQLRGTGSLAQAGGRDNDAKAKDIAERAYVMMCQTVNIMPYMDPVAYGPLHLESVDIVSFGPPQRARSPVGKVSAKTGIARGAVASKEKSAASLSASGPGNVKLANNSISQAVLQLDDGVDATCSGCNKAFTAHAVLSYFGSGAVDATWKVKLKGKKGVQSFPATGPGTVGRSPAREGDPKNWKDPLPGTHDLYSPALPVDPADVYEIWVEVKVKPEPLFDHAFRLQGRGGVVDVNALAAQRGEKAVKVGFLRPSREGGKSSPPVLYANDAQTSTALAAAGRKLSATSSRLAGGLNLDGQQVKSPSKKYKVVAIDPSKPCEFYFAGEQGDKFSVYLDQQNLPKESGGTYSGSGTLDVKLTSSSNGATLIPNVGVSFQNWQVDQAGNVAPGTKLSQTVSSGPISTMGLTDVSVAKIEGTAGKEMKATLNAKLGDSFLLFAGSGDVPSWKTAANLRQNGDWSAKVKLDKKVALGWSGFYLNSSDVTLDLSRSTGQGPDACGGASGSNWVGVNFGSADIEINTSDLAPVTIQSSNWGVTNHACGKFSLQNDPRLMNLSVGKGTISFNKVSLEAKSSGTFDAHYNIDVQLPFLNALLHSDDVQLLSSNQKEGSFEFAGVKPKETVQRDFGPIHLSAKPDSFRFGFDKSGGWRAIVDPELSFKAEGKAFNSEPIAVPDMRFGMNGRAYFDENGTATRDIPLGGFGDLGKSRLELQGLHLTGGASGNERLKMAFSGQVRLSPSLPAANVQAIYKISGDSYEGSGPVSTPFNLKVAFPAGQPVTEASIDPVYDPKPNPGTRYTGSVDIGMFGGPPIKGEFLLGYEGSTDYWLTRLEIPLGASGVSLSPVPLTLYRVRGGLGYHVTGDSLQGGKPIGQAAFSSSADTSFMVGMRVGSSDKFTVMMDGDFTVTTGASAGARMDFRAWLLKASQSGDGDFTGFFKYGGGNFDGRLWGNLDMLSGAIRFDLGNGENNAAVDLHVGGGSWHVYAGKNTGPRIRGHILIQDADSYLMLGSDTGLAVGGAQQVYLGVGASSVASAYVKGYMDMGLQITTQPKVAGDFAAGVEAGACIVGGCYDAGVTAAVHAEAFPVDVRAKAKIEIPLAPDVSFTVHL